MLNHRVLIEVHAFTIHGRTLYEAPWDMMTVPRKGELVYINSQDHDRPFHDCVMVEQVVHHLVDKDDECSITYTVKCVLEG